MKLFIGIGTTHMQMAPTLVLGDSLRQYAGDIELVIKSIHEEQEHADIASLSSLSIGTVFSLQRFLVAKIGARYGCHYALYIDSDIICLNPFKAMIEQFATSERLVCIASPNPRFRQPTQSAVMLTRTDSKACNFFARSLHQYIHEHHSYARLLADLTNEENALKVEHIFNSRDYVEDRTVFLHYTDLWTQPWVSPFRKEGAVWYKKHAQMLANNAAYKALVVEGVAQKFYRPGILAPNYFSPRDIIFLPPQIKVYAARYGVAWAPDWLLGLTTQCYAWLRASTNDRTT